MNIPATRMNLLSHRSRLGLARDGAALLKNKREALIRDFFSIMDTMMVSRDEMAVKVQRSMTLLGLAKCYGGTAEVRAGALSSDREIPIRTREINIWGIRIPEIDFVSLRRSPEARGMMPVDTPVHILEAAEGYEELLEQLLRVASQEVRLKRLGEEIRKVSRRINALEQSLIPGLTGEIRFMREVLEEREREDRFRLKQIKGKASKKPVPGS